MSVEITEATQTSISYVVGIPERQSERVGPTNKLVPIAFTIALDNSTGEFAVGDHIDIIVRKLSSPKEPA